MRSSELGPLRALDVNIAGRGEKATPISIYLSLLHTKALMQALTPSSWLPGLSRPWIKPPSRRSRQAASLCGYRCSFQKATLKLLRSMYDGR